MIMTTKKRVAKRSGIKSPTSFVQIRRPELVYRREKAGMSNWTALEERMGAYRGFMHRMLMLCPNVSMMPVGKLVRIAQALSTPEHRVTLDELLEYGETLDVPLDRTP